MGLFVSRLLSNDMRTLELMMGEIARACREGQLEHLLYNDSFWSVVSLVSSNPATLSELRGYVSGLLEEDWRTSSMLLDMLSPGMSSTQRRFVVSIVKLELISRALRSEVFWHLVMDRGFVTALWKHASGRELTVQERQRLQQPYDRKENRAASTPVVSSPPPPPHHPMASVVLTPPSVNDSRPFVPPAPLERFFTILTLPAIIALLTDIAREPISVVQPTPPPPPTPTPSSATGKPTTRGKRPSAGASSNPTAAPSPPPPPPLPADSKTNLILLFHRDLVKLEHIFDRERAAVAPVPGADPTYTGLGFERKYYIVLRGVIKFMLSGNGKRGSPNEPPSAMPQSLFARILLDPRFQRTFLSKEFLSSGFQQKLHYFMSIFPEDMTVDWASHSASHMGPSSPPPPIDVQLCHALRAYGAFFVQLLADPHVQLFCTFVRTYDRLFLEHLFEALYVDIILPLLKPERYVHQILTAPQTHRHAQKAASSKEKEGANGQHVPSSSSKKKPLRSTPVPTLPPSTFANEAALHPASQPFRAPSSLLLAIGFVYHWLFEPVPLDIIEQSAMHVKRHRSLAAGGGAPSVGGEPLARLRDALMHLETYAAWAAIAASTSSRRKRGGHRHASSAASFTSSVHELVFHPASLALLDFLQAHAPHLAFCASKALDELNHLWRPVIAGALNEMPDGPTTAPPPVDMFAPHLSFHEGAHPVTPPAEQAPVLMPPAPTVQIRAAPAPTGLLSWLWGSSAPVPVPMPAEPAPIIIPAPVLASVATPLAPQLVSPRTRFGAYFQHQLRLWCSRVMEGRGFTLFAQQTSTNSMATPTSVPSSIFVFGPAYAAAEEASRALFPPIAPIAPDGTATDAIFYAELLFFSPVFVEKLLCLVFTYEWMDRRDLSRRKAKKLRTGNGSNGGGNKMVVRSGAHGLSSITSSSSSSLVFHSPLFPMVQRSMSNPQSTPIDLGPVRTREYIALLCRSLADLLQEAHIANFLNRSEHFWRFLIDTRWWDLIQDASTTKNVAAVTTTTEDANADAPTRAPSSQRAMLHSLLTLVSDQSSSYYLVLLELGHYTQFHEIFSDVNIAQVLSILRLVCSWHVHEIMARYEAEAANVANTTATSGGPPSSQSQDIYSTLTAPFTFWGIVHSLSVVGPLLQQYKGALHWFLSKRNMEMQVDIWRVVKEILYGNNAAAPGDDQPDEGAAAHAEAMRSDHDLDLDEVPPSAPLHTVLGAADSSPYTRQKVRWRRLMSVAQIFKSVHSSGIIQAVFTFPLATAHFYSVNASEYLWSTRSLSVDAHFPKKPTTHGGDATAAGPSDSTSISSDGSSTSLLVSQVFTLFYTMAGTASSQSFLNIPTVRSAFLEWVNVALEEVSAHGSGVRTAQRERARLEKAEFERRRLEARAQAKLAAEQAKQAAADQERAEKEAAAEATKARKRRSTRTGKLVVVVPPPTVTSAAPTQALPLPPPSRTPTPPPAPDMFDAHVSLRISTPPVVTPPPAVGSLLGPRAGAEPTIEIKPLMRAQSEVRKIFPSLHPQPQPHQATPSHHHHSTTSVTSASHDTVEATPLPSNIPPRFKADSEVSADESKPAVAPVEVSDDVVSLPPPFAFESTSDDEDDERGSAASRAAAAAAARTPSLQAEPALDPTPGGSPGANSGPSSLSPLPSSSSPSSNSAPVLPSLPQRHRLLYSFFQLLLHQPIFKLVLTSASFWEMLSDVSFLEIAASLIFGPPTETNKPAPSQTHMTTGARSAFQAARSQLAHTQQVLSSRRAQLKLVQQLLAHSRFKILMADLKAKQFEVHAAECCTQLLAFLNSPNGRALIVAVMDGLQQREAKPASSSANTGTMSLSARFRALTDLLSHESTSRLLTAPRFWLLFADPATLGYFSNGQYVRLWLHHQPTLRQLPLWELIKKGGIKVKELRRKQQVDQLRAQQSLHEPDEEAHSQPQPQAAASRLGSKREAVKMFVKRRLSSQSQSSASMPSPSSPSTFPPPPPPPAALPSGLLALQHFVTLVQAVSALVSGETPVTHSPLRSQL